MRVARSSNRFPTHRVEPDWLQLPIAVCVSFLFACGSLEQMPVDRGSGDGGMVGGSGPPGAASIDSSTALAGDGGSGDGQVSASDANTSDSGPAGDAGVIASDSGASSFEPMQRVVFVHMGHGFGRQGLFTPEGTRDDPALVNALEPLAPFVDRALVVDGINANPYPLDRSLDSLRPCPTSVSHGCPFTLLSGLYRGTSTSSPRTIDHRLAEWLGDGVRESLSAVAATSQDQFAASLPNWLTTYDASESPVAPVNDPAAYISSLTTPPIPAPSPEAAALLSDLKADLPRLDSAEARVRFFARAVAAKVAFGATRVVTWTVAHQNLVLRGVVDVARRDTVSAVDHLGTLDQRLTLKRWCVAQVAELVAQLDAIPEGSGTILDHTLVVLYSDAVNEHVASNAPAVVIGGGAPSLRLGEYITLNQGVTYGSDRMIDVMATIVSALGMDIDGIGPPDAPARILPELLR